ncbi:MAG: patatin-like phospholipase family protein [Patescibacteria group bacterium]
MSSRKTIGLALGSGAYRGFAHIGVIRALERGGIPIDFLSGASIGAWAAAYYAIFRDIGALEKDLIDNQKENMSLLLDFGWTRGIISGDKFLAYLDKKLNHADFSDLQIPLNIAATDLATGRPYVFSAGSVARAVRASCAVPLVFKVFEHGDRLLADGGMSDPVPVDLAVKMGADITIAVNLYHQNEFQEQKYTESNLLVRSTMTMLSNLSQAVMHQADVVIEPDLSSFVKKSSLAKYFDKQTADAIIKIGEEAAEQAIPAIRRLLS